MEVLLLVGFVVALWLLARVFLRQKPQSATAAALNQRLASVRLMSGSQFEHFVADIMRGLGYRTQVLGGSGDQGVDVIATRGDERIAIQCKQHGRPVNNSPVQQVFTGATHHRCTRAMVVAPMGFTKEAMTVAKSVGVELHNSNSLRTWILHIQPVEEPQERRTVDLDVESTKQEEKKEEYTMAEGGMEKHTVNIGKRDRIIDTVSFTAKMLGTASVNGGKEAERGMDWTYYRLPDGTFRMLMDDGNTTLLEPANVAQALERDEPIEYGRWTLEELQNEPEYGKAFRALMKQHAENMNPTVRDLD